MLTLFLCTAVLATPYVRVLSPTEPVLREYGPFGLNDDMAKYMHQTAWMHSPQQNMRNPYLVTQSSDTFRPSPYYFGYSPPPPPMYHPMYGRNPYSPYSQPGGYPQYGGYNNGNHGGSFHGGSNNFHSNQNQQQHRLLTKTNNHVPPGMFYPWFVGPGGPGNMPMAPPLPINSQPVMDPSQCLDSLGVEAAQILSQSYCGGSTYMSLAISLDCTSYGYYQGSNSQESSDNHALDYCQDRCARSGCSQRCEVMATDDGICSAINSRTGQGSGYNSGYDSYGTEGGYTNWG